MIGARTYGPVRCTDCDRDFLNRPDETGALCDECCADRDAHTDVLELRFMLKAVLRADLTKVREVA